MRAAFHHHGKQKPQGWIRVLDEINEFISCKPNQIRNLRKTDIKGKSGYATIILHTSEDHNGQKWATDFPVKTSVELLEQIIDLAEMGYTIDLTPYSGNAARELKSLNDLRSTNNRAQPQPLKLSRGLADPFN